MDLQDALEFLRSNHRSILIARRPDGEPQPSPVVHGVDEAGKVVVSSREPAYKVRNLRRDPRVTLCAFTDNFFGEWVTVEGRADIVALPEALEPLVDLYRSVAGEHPDWADYREAMVREKRVIISITPVSAGPDRAG
ncbi:MAG TPA: PPOX class F420-dependent oxidoreductase [Acidimicrobiales bacterium]|nr:PPOX class F420-dependent oxidoreductase [Acidimicrobiales bacterium]